MRNRSRHRKGRQALWRTCVPFIVRAGAGLMVWLMCVTVTPALGQGPQLDLPEESRPAEAPQAEHREKLTKKEEKAHQERQKRFLDILTAENGTNPTAIIGRFQLSDSYRNLAGGAERNDTTFRVDIPLTPDWLLRADVAGGWIETNRPGESDTFGLNDLFLRTGWRVYQSPDLNLFVGGDAIFPTATDTQLGRGKYEIGPGIAASIPIPSIESTFFPLFQYFVSVGGNPSRPDVDFSRLELQLNTLWSKEWWTLFEGNLNVDWTRGAKTGVVLEGEVGRRLGSHWRAWVRPGVGLWGQDVRGTYDWGAQFGIRYMFYVY